MRRVEDERLDEGEAVTRGDRGRRVAHRRDAVAAAVILREIGLDDAELAAARRRDRRDRRVDAMGARRLAVSLPIHRHEERLDDGNRAVGRDRRQRLIHRTAPWRRIAAR
jgi:hypothetical protein